MASADSRLERCWPLVLAAALTTSACQRGPQAKTSDVIKAVLASLRTPQSVTQVVVDADVSRGDLEAATGLPPVRVGPADLDRNTRSLKAGELALVGLRVNGREAEVDTRSVSAHTHQPGATLDCGNAQTFVLTQDVNGQWKVAETRITQC